MEISIDEIEMHRGDIKNYKFAILYPSGNICDLDFDNIYFTVKKNYKTSEYLFQKRLSDKSIRRDLNNYYHFTIEPEDTNDLAYKEYVFDIEIVKNYEIKQTFLGTFTITNEVTFAGNEV